MTPEMREELQRWQEREGYSSEADAIRGMIRTVAMGDEMIQEFRDRDEVMDKLRAIEDDIKELHEPFWYRLFEDPPDR